MSQQFMNTNQNSKENLLYKIKQQIVKYLNKDNVNKFLYYITCSSKMSDVLGKPLCVKCYHIR